VLLCSQQYLNKLLYVCNAVAPLSYIRLS